MAHLHHVLEPNDLSVNEIDRLCALAQNIYETPKNFSQIAQGKLLASLFYEPSTRTKFSFDAAMYRLGGNVLGFADPNTSSASKGETMADTTRIICNYVDLIVTRHPKEGTAKLMSKYASVPVINAGDGGHQHPTQTLADLFTIRHFKKSLHGHIIGFCGDLKFGRTIHSLVKAMSRYDNIHFVFIAPEELKLPDYIKEEIKGKATFEETTNLEEVIGSLDILYMSRVQGERFVSEEEYLRLKDTYILDSEKMKLAKSDMIVMHPLPRVNEISAEIDKDPRAVYFDQAKFGMYMRMALIIKLLRLEDKL